MQNGVEEISDEDDSESYYSNKGREERAHRQAFTVKNWTIGIMPAAFEYRGIPTNTATNTANGLLAPAKYEEPTRH